MFSKVNLSISKGFLVRRNCNFLIALIFLFKTLSRARGGTALIQRLLCDRVTFEEISLRYITTSSKSLVKLLLNCLTLKGFIKRTAGFRHFSFKQMNRRIQNCLSVEDGMSEHGSFLDISK